MLDPSTSEKLAMIVGFPGRIVEYSCQNYDSTMRFYDFAFYFERNDLTILLSRI
jgi:hypothetical protein